MEIGDDKILKLINNENVATANICYINSSIQLMKKTGYVKFILSNICELPTKDKEVCHELYNLICNDSSKAKSAGLIRKLVAEKSKKIYFNSMVQQDVEEFLRALIDVVNLELHDVSDFETIKTNHIGRERVSKMFLDNLPLGTCFKCNELPSSRIEPFLFLKLIVPRAPRKINLLTLIEHHYSSNNEVLSMKCSNCCPHAQMTVPCPQTGFCSRKATSKTEILELPDYLLITLLRFGEAMMENKVHTTIEFCEQLTLPSGTIFSPISCIEHQGQSLNSGHYVNYSKDSTGQWWLLNDTNSSKVRFGQMVNSSLYIILLKTN